MRASTPCAMSSCRRCSSATSRASCSLRAAQLARHRARSASSWLFSSTSVRRSCCTCSVSCWLAVVSSAMRARVCSSLLHLGAQVEDGLAGLVVVEQRGLRRCGDPPPHDGSQDEKPFASAVLQFGAAVASPTPPRRCPARPAAPCRSSPPRAGCRWRPAASWLSTASARFWPSARLYSRPPRSSVWPSSAALAAVGGQPLGMELDRRPELVLHDEAVEVEVDDARGVGVGRSSARLRSTVATADCPAPLPVPGPPAVAPALPSPGARVSTGAFSSSLTLEPHAATTMATTTEATGRSQLTMHLSFP